MKRFNFILIMCFIALTGVQAVEYTLYTSSSVRSQSRKATGFMSLSSGVSSAGAIAPSLNLQSETSVTLGRSSAFAGHTTIPQSQIYQPFSGYEPTAMYKGPGDGHSGGNDTPEPTIEPVGDMIIPLLIAALVYILFLSCKRKKYSISH